MKYAFEQAGITQTVQVAEDGRQAMDYLDGKGQYADRVRFPLPALTLLDLKMPGCSGLVVLGWIQQSLELRTLLVIVLTSSPDPNDVDEAYRLGARSLRWEESGVGEEW